MRDARRTATGLALRVGLGSGLATVLALPTGLARAADDPVHRLRAIADALLNDARASAADCGDGPRVLASAGAPSDADPATARPRLQWNPLLEAAAARHAGAMARTRLFDHLGADGTTVRERVTATGYRWRLVAENLAAGQARLEDALVDWLASRSHCAALLDPRFTEFGLARTESTHPGDPYGIYWTLVLGRPR